MFAFCVHLFMYSLLLLFAVALKSSPQSLLVARFLKLHKSPASWLLLFVGALNLLSWREIDDKGVYDHGDRGDCLVAGLTQWLVSELQWLVDAGGSGRSSWTRRRPKLP